MCKRMILYMFAFLSGVLLQADVVMNLEMSRTSFMRFEPVLATLTLRNTSGQALIFGGEAEFKGHLEIELSDLTDRPIRGSGTKVDLRGMILRSGVDHRIRVNLSKWVNLTQVGLYRVKLAISHPMLKDEYESNGCQFDVSTGKVFWSRRFGVPKLEDHAIGDAAQLRNYTIRGLQDGSSLYFYLSVEDDQNIYTMKRIGRALGREQPVCEIDMLNRLHVLLPLTPKIFQYQVFDWNGLREINKIYKTAERVPLLFRDARTGDVKIIGGEAASLGIDYTEEKLLPDAPMLGTAEELESAHDATRRATEAGAADAAADRKEADLPNSGTK